MQQLGLKHLRLSLSWSRLVPGGRKGSAVNPEAVQFYSSVLDELAAAGTCGTQTILQQDGVAWLSMLIVICV
jgi:beta-glucosidase/6-phospho-beta-glucosidase/beta-galactosidase